MRNRNEITNAISRLPTHKQAAYRARLKWLQRARPKQIPPTHLDWFAFLALAGRGFGKTLLCAEDSWWYCAWNDGVRMAVVAPTNADLRRTVFEGESGLLAVCPPEVLLPGDKAYNRGTNELHFLNGSVIQGFSSESYQRLRGPQFHRAWLEEMCLVAGTSISTEQGTQPIEAIRTGCRVRTRSGLKRVSRAWQTSDSAEVYRLRTSLGDELIGTAQHPVFVNGKGFIPLKSLVHGDILERCVTYRKEYRESSNGVDRSGICEKEMATTPTERASSYTGSTIKQFMDRCRYTLTFTIKTKLEAIGTSTTSKQRPERTTWLRTSPGASGNGPQKIVRGRRENNGEKSRLKLLSAITAALVFRQRERGLGSVVEHARQLSLGLAASFVEQFSVAFALRSTKSKTSMPRKFGVALSALWHREKEYRESHQNSVRPVEQHSGPQIQKQRPVQEHADLCTVVEIEKLPELQPVFNIEVEDDHEYFANGILTHNCAWPYMQETWDMLNMTLRLIPRTGRPQLIISTTPKPFKLINELVAREDVFKVTGSTYENQSNLAPEFLKVIQRQYEGTRIGKQELLGHILNEVLGALWNWRMIERCRYVGVVPEWKYLTVNIDPSVGDGNPDNDECGITATGLGRDDFGYVLHDRSLQGSPNEWVGAAVRLYHELGAHWIVAEANNGGKLIESAIHAIDASIPVRLVHASQGKRTRAEPVAMLYEQGRVRHFGVHADLESQMCDWSPEISKYSPGRMDALVWGLTALMVEKPSDFFCFVA